MANQETAPEGNKKTVPDLRPESMRKTAPTIDNENAEAIIDKRFFELSMLTEMNKQADAIPLATSTPDLENDKGRKWLDRSSSGDLERDLQMSPKLKKKSVIMTPYPLPASHGEKMEKLFSNAAKTLKAVHSKDGKPRSRSQSAREKDPSRQRQNSSTSVHCLK